MNVVVSFKTLAVIVLLSAIVGAIGWFWLKRNVCGGGGRRHHHDETSPTPTNTSSNWWWAQRRARTNPSPQPQASAQPSLAPSSYNEILNFLAGYMLPTRFHSPCPHPPPSQPSYPHPPPPQPCSSSTTPLQQQHAASSSTPAAPAAPVSSSSTLHQSFIELVEEWGGSKSNVFRNARRADIVNPETRQHYTFDSLYDDGKYRIAVDYEGGNSGDEVNNQVKQAIAARANVFLAIVPRGVDSKQALKAFVTSALQNATAAATSTTSSAVAATTGG